MRTISASDNSETIYLFLMYDYYERLTTCPPGIVISVSDYGTEGLGSIPGWAPILQCFFMLNYFILVIWNYKNDKKMTSLCFILNYARTLCGWG